MKKQRVLVLYSGGLDSRLAVKILEEQGYDVEAIHFILPFGCSCNLECGFKFTQLQGVKLDIIDVTKSPLLEDYLNVIKHPRYNRGSSFNPCIDCKIWIFKKAKEYADAHNIDLLATGEVLGQRPMSQNAKAMAIIDKELGFQLKRPLIEMGMSGRTRKKQMELAKNYKIQYPSPSGGCLLCEKALYKRFKLLLGKNMVTPKTLQIVKIARHFYIPETDAWFVVARNEKESFVIERQDKENVLDSSKKTPAVFFYPKNQTNKELAKQLQEAYKQKNPKDFEKWKI